MRHIFLVMQNETDNDTYSEDELIGSYEAEDVAAYVAAHLQNEVGFVTQFNEERTFSVKKVDVNQDKDPQKIDDILDELHDKFNASWEK